MDPLLDMIRILRPRAALWGGLEGAGSWGLAFHKRDDLLFCWLERGSCILTRPAHSPLYLNQSDFVLVRTSSPFTLTSDPGVRPVDSEAPTAPRAAGRFRLGSGTEARVTIHAGRFLFDSENEHLLLDLLPSIIHVAADAVGSERVRTLLSMMRAETLQPLPGGEFVALRLIEIVLVELLRRKEMGSNQARVGLVAGLGDPMIARALAALHGDVAKDWTVANLARLCGASRSTFAARFRRIIGLGPIDYLMRWRMTLAKYELRRGEQRIGVIGRSIGFQSSSAFSTAFTRAVGCSPREFAASRDE